MKQSNGSLGKERKEESDTSNNLCQQDTHLHAAGRPQKFCQLERQPVEDKTGSSWGLRCPIEKVMPPAETTPPQPTPLAQQAIFRQQKWILQLHTDMGSISKSS